jgi:hypothetical protein
MVEEQLATLAPVALDGQKLIWDEDSLGAAYGQGTKCCDQVIDAGRALVATDIVSGQLKVATRVEGNPTAFKEDLEKLVFKKIRQLDDTANNLIADEKALTGVSPKPPRPVYPVVAIGSAFSRNPVVSMVIEEQRDNEGLLANPLVRPLSVIDLPEVEMLAGLADGGASIPDLLDGWHQSGIADMSFRNHLLRVFGRNYRGFRSAHLKQTVDEIIANLCERYGFDPQDIT